MRNKIRIVLIGILSVVLVVSGGMVLRDVLRARREEAAFAVLEEQRQPVPEVHIPPEAVTVPTPPGKPASPSREADPAAPAETAILEQDEDLTPIDPMAWLWSQNHDCVGWLAIEGTNINYPVMYTPQEQDYYLRRGFDKSDSYSGSLFVAVPWTYGHTLIYGHNMKDGAMFGDLIKYKEEAYFQAHPAIQFDTLLETGTYQILAAFESQAVEGVFDYWSYVDLSEEDRFRSYVEQVKAAACYETGVSASYGDVLLTLSTCSYHADEGRFVVVAKKTG